MRKRIALVALTAVSLALVGCGGGGDAESGDDPAASSGGASIEVEAGDLYFEPEQLSASAGEVSVTVDNVGEAEHDFVIEEMDDLLVAHAAPGESVTETVTLEAGTYTFYCSVPGHRTTMEGTLEVS